MPQFGCQRSDHPTLGRRTAVQIGAVGLLGLGMNHLVGLRGLAADNGVPAITPRAKAVIYIFLSGGLGQHDSFDMKPDAPLDIRGNSRRSRHEHPVFPSVSTYRCWRLAAINGHSCVR